MDSLILDYGGALDYGVPAGTYYSDPAGEIEALTAKLEASEKENSLLQQVETNLTELHNSALATITEQAAQIEALEKDAARWCSIHALMFIGNVELSQCEDGGYSISIDPVENIIGKTWVGDTPEDAIDAAILGDSHLR